MSSYPKISLSDASELLQLRNTELISSKIINEKTQGGFSDDNTHSRFQDTLERIAEYIENDLLNKNTNSNRPKFTEKASRLLHEEGKVDIAWARDPDFWRWLTFAFDALGAEIVKWRYKTKENPNARDVYYGLGQIHENLFYSLWKKSDIYYSEEDGYSLLSAISDEDFYVSHVLRVEWACCKSLARSFSKLVKKHNIPRGIRNDPNEPAGYRDFAVELQRRFPTTTYELMDDDTANAFLEYVWQTRQYWCGKT